jgi:hypothetical protein
MSTNTCGHLKALLAFHTNVFFLFDKI